MSSQADRDLARLRAAKRLRDDLPLYARECLRIKLKAGGEAQPFVFNASQQFLHIKCEEQKARTGKVRKLVLKGRQVGVSTYIGGRIYHKTTHRKGVRSFILTHEDKATDNLFGMVDRFHSNCPLEVRPETGTASAKALSFPALDSDYKVGTAGNKATGRSETIQYFHGSEVAFWPNADDHLAGIMQAIADAPDTEVFLESTANGIGGVFHALWEKAERGETEFEAVFIPWYVHEEYSKEPPRGWVAPQKFDEYGVAYELTPPKLYWAWLKNRELAGDGDSNEFCWKFKQEYPADAAEAFQVSGANQFINPEVVLKARKRIVPGIGPIILGVDPSSGGRDTMGIIDRQGRRMGGHECSRHKTSRDVRANVGIAVAIIKRMRAQGASPKKICVDAADAGFVILLEEALGPDIVVPVMFGEAAYDTERYANRRAELADTMRQWYDDPVGVQVPDRADFQKEACSTSWGAGMTHKRPNGQLVIEPKDKVKERLKASPDLGFDAAALTFGVDYSELREPEPEKQSGGRLGAARWMT